MGDTKEYEVSDKGKTVMDSVKQGFIIADKYIEENKLTNSFSNRYRIAELMINTGYKVETLELLNEILRKAIE